MSVGCSLALAKRVPLFSGFPSVCLSVCLCTILFRLELRNYGSEIDETWWLGPLGGEWLRLRELAP